MLWGLTRGQWLRIVGLFVVADVVYFGLTSVAYFPSGVAAVDPLRVANLKALIDPFPYLLAGLLWWMYAPGSRHGVVWPMLQDNNMAGLRKLMAIWTIYCAVLLAMLRALNVGILAALFKWYERTHLVGASMAVPGSVPAALWALFTVVVAVWAFPLMLAVALTSFGVCLWCVLKMRGAVFSAAVAGATGGIVHYGILWLPRGLDGVLGRASDRTTLAFAVHWGISIVLLVAIWAWLRRNWKALALRISVPVETDTH